MAALLVSFQQEIPHGGYKGAEEKKDCVWSKSLLFQIINVADFKAPKCNACEDLSVVESPEHWLYPKPFLYDPFYVNLSSNLHQAHKSRSQLLGVLTMFECEISHLCPVLLLIYQHPFSYWRGCLTSRHFPSFLNDGGGSLSRSGTLTFWTPL